MMNCYYYLPPEPEPDIIDLYPLAPLPLPIVVKRLRGLSLRISSGEQEEPVYGELFLLLSSHLDISADMSLL